MVFQHPELRHPPLRTLLRVTHYLIFPWQIQHKYSKMPSWSFIPIFTRLWKTSTKMHWTHYYTHIFHCFAPKKPQIKHYYLFDKHVLNQKHTHLSLCCVSGGCLTRLSRRTTEWSWLRSSCSSLELVCTAAYYVLYYVFLQTHSNHFVWIYSPTLKNLCCNSLVAFRCIDCPVNTGWECLGAGICVRGNISW